MRLLFSILMLFFLGVIQAQDKPNIIFILADDMGIGDVSPYGQKTIQTPNIQKLSDEGMTFSDFYAGSTVCAPSRASMLTGQHTGHTKVRGNGEYPLDDKKQIFPEILKKAGYQNAIFGKWGMGLKNSPSTPLSRGFDAFAGFLHHIDAHFQTPDSLDVIRQGRLERMALQQGTYANDYFLNQTLDFIDKNANKSPFFIYLSLTVPHAELSVADIHYEKQFDSNGTSIHPNEKAFKGGHYGAQEFPKAAYAAMVSSIDYYVGQILQKVADKNIDDNTIIIFSSDNGTHVEGGRTAQDVAYFQSSGEYRGVKRDLYEGGIRVPFIVRWKGHVAPNSQSNFRGGFWDLYPTFSEVAGVSLSKNDPLDGISFKNALLGKRQKKHKYLYWEFHEFGGKQALIKGNWKAIRLNVSQDPKGKIELYNLKDDVSETRNLADKYPCKARKMTKYLDGVRTRSEIFNFTFKKNK